MKNIFDSAKTIKEKRTVLKNLSATLKELKKTGVIDNINSAILAIYHQAGHNVLKTFEEWQREGKRVKKGEKALCLWAKPVPVGEKKSKGQKTFFPVKLLFSNLQVYEKKETHNG